MRNTILSAFLVLWASSPLTQFGCAQTEAEVVANVVAATEKLMASLNEGQRAKVQFAFDDEEQRRRWSNLPTGIVKREGLKMGDLTEAQKSAVMGILKATLSERGMQQVVENMDGDEVLKTRGGGGRTIFGKDEYYFSILGKPSTTTAWMCQFGGHHFALNATFRGNRLTLSPSLTGGQPIEYELNGKKVRQLGQEVDKAHLFLQSLTADQKKQAVIGSELSDMQFGPGKETAKPKLEGLQSAKLDAQQKKLLLDLIEERIGIVQSVHSKKTMEKIASDIDQVWFAWFGPTEAGSAASYRIIGPTIVMEYCPQRMGGNASQHVHAMYRDLTNDYGAAQ